MYDLKKFEKNIKEIIELSLEILELRESGVTGDASVEQIEGTILPEMNSLLKDIEQKCIKSKELRWINSAAYITRGWNWDIRKNGCIDLKSRELGVLLMNLDSDYRKNL